MFPITFAIILFIIILCIIVGQYLSGSPAQFPLRGHSGGAQTQGQHHLQISPSPCP